MITESSGGRVAIVAPVATGTAACSPWWTRAACSGHDPEWWADDCTNYPAAVSICLACPVRDHCLAEATDAGDVGVVRGGVLLRQVRGKRRIVPLACLSCGQRPSLASRHGRASRCAVCTRRERVIPSA